MRILMISDVYFPRINGVSTSIQTFKTEFESKGHDVVLIAPVYPAAYHHQENIIRVSSRAIPFDPEDRMMKYRDTINLIPQLERYQFDLVHIHTPFVAHYAGVKIASKLGIPCVITYHTLFEEYLFHYIPYVPKFLLRLLARRFSTSQCNQANGIIVPSSIIVNLLKGYGVDNSVKIIPTGINAGKFVQNNRNNFRNKFGIPENKKVLLNVSRVAFEKNIGVLIEMLNKAKTLLPDVHLVIAGEGPAKNSYVEQANKLGLNDHISFVGYLDRDSELIDCYHSADVFVFSSKTETQGLVLLEAMAAGTPVVSIAAMGTKDVLKGCEGAIITDGSVDDFCHKVVTLLQNQDAMAKLANEAVLYARQWDSAALAGNMIEYYDQIVTVH